MTVAYRKGRHVFTIAPGVLLDEDFDEPEIFVAWLREQAFEGHLGDAVVPDASTWQCDPPQRAAPEPHRRERPVRGPSPPPPPPPPLPPRDHLAAAAELRALGMEEEAQIAERLERDRIACRSGPIHGPGWTMT